MLIRTLAVMALALATFPRPAAAQPDALRDRFAARLEATEGEDTPRPAYGRMWDVMDSVVLRELGRGRSPDEINQTLAGFPGFSGAMAGDGVTIGQGTFYSELPRELPGYVVLPVRSGGTALMMGVYNFGMNSPGRVSLFARRAGRWTRTGKLDARFAVTPYLLPLADSALAIVTLDLFTGGDHQDGSVRVWLVRNGGLELLRTLTGEMKEPEARIDAGAVRVAFTRFPLHLDAPILGIRIAHVTTISAAGAGVTVRDEIANPWVEVVDRYYGLLRQSPARARALLATPSLAGRLGTRAPTSYDDGGDLRGGTGWIVLGIGDRRYRVTSRRATSGQWHITAVEPAPAPKADG
ncbi:MAG TPA: hypothetical protein VFJ16_17355 [Longimicrobium sp.]|nr:hypothetical protein [Longimicrobium sp.]